MNYTSTEQSKKLIEAGLNPDTADCSYCLMGMDDNNHYYSKPDWETVEDNTDIPCWSTGALLNLMPPYLFEFSRGIDLNIYRNVSNKRWVISYLPNNIESMQKDKFRQFCFGDTLIDAACDMVLWLLEKGFIKREEQ